MVRVTTLNILKKNVKNSSSNSDAINRLFTICNDFDCGSEFRKAFKYFTLKNNTGHYMTLPVIGRLETNEAYDYASDMLNILRPDQKEQRSYWDEIATDVRPDGIIEGLTNSNTICTLYIKPNHQTGMHKATPKDVHKALIVAEKVLGILPKSHLKVSNHELNHLKSSIESLQKCKTLLKSSETMFSILVMMEKEYQKLSEKNE